MHGQSNHTLTVCLRSIIYSGGKHKEGCCLEGVPDLRRGLLGDDGGLTWCYGLEVCSVFAAKYLWIEYDQASKFLYLHLFPWRN